MTQAWWGTAWCWAGIAVTVGILLLDSLLGRRYAQGDGSRDGGSVRLLLLSCGGNLTLSILSPALGFGLLPASVAHLLAPLGLVVMLAGVALRYTAIFSLGDRFTWRVAILPEHELMQDGVYRHVRHPSYTGGLISMYGVTLLFGSWIGFVVLSLTHVPIVVYRIRVEEKTLASHFGERWSRYAGKTWRLVPYLY